jgi:hypothetical protein
MPCRFPSCHPRRVRVATASAALPGVAARPSDADRMARTSMTFAIIPVLLALSHIPCDASHVAGYWADYRACRTVGVEASEFPCGPASYKLDTCEAARMRINNVQIRAIAEALEGPRIARFAACKRSVHLWRPWTWKECRF